MKHGLLSAPIYAVVARAYYTADRERLARFCEVYRSGKYEEDGDVAAVRLRDVMLTTEGHGSVVATMRYAKAERALKARRRVERVHATQEELFPVPTGPASPK